MFAFPYDCGENVHNVVQARHDSPVSGGVRRAADGTLAIMVGGDTATHRPHRCAAPGAIGTSIFCTGALGSGDGMKALNNYVWSAGVIATVEALLIGRKFGLDPALMADILNVPSGKNSTTELKLKQFIISQTFADGFPLRLMAKDVRTADDMAHALGIATPMRIYVRNCEGPQRRHWTRRRITRRCWRHMEGLGE